MSVMLGLTGNYLHLSEKTLTVLVNCWCVKKKKKSSQASWATFCLVGVFSTSLRIRSHSIMYCINTILYRLKRILQGSRKDKKREKNKDHEVECWVSCSWECGGKCVNTRRAPAPLCQQHVWHEAKIYKPSVTSNGAHQTSPTGSTSLK